VPAPDHGSQRARGRARRGQLREEEGRSKRKEREEKKGKKEERKKKRKGRKGKNRNRKKFRKLGEFLGKIRRGEEGFLRIFLGFPDTGINFGTAVMAKRIGRRDCGVRGIPGVVADRGAGAARDGRWPGCGRCQQDSRHERQRGGERGKTTGVLKGVVELSENVLKTRVI
jgi:hypothetical protein